MTQFPQHDDDWYRARLALPHQAMPGLASSRPRVVIDTDAANEIDDQFALAWALLSPAQLDVLAVYAAPFSFAHRRAALPHASASDPQFNPPATGMLRSYDEINKVYSLLGLQADGKVFRGSEGYLPSLSQPCRSEAVDHLIATARAGNGSQPLYVLALGCVTNIASALLLAPDIVSRIVVVWTSGYPSHAPHINHSFNLEQDLLASQLLLDSGVPHVYLPGYHVGAQLRLSLPEMERHVQGCGAIGNYLHELFTHNPLWPLLGMDGKQPACSWVIWDVINVAWMLVPEWVPSELVRTPQLGDDKRWYSNGARHLMREAHEVNRDAMFSDFFNKLKTAP
ncbi:nucleoside hydrolase [soil metagenome]